MLDAVTAMLVAATTFHDAWIGHQDWQELPDWLERNKQSGCRSLIPIGGFSHSQIDRKDCPNKVCDRRQTMQQNSNIIVCSKRTLGLCMHRLQGCLRWNASLLAGLIWSETMRTSSRKDQDVLGRPWSHGDMAQACH